MSGGVDGRLTEAQIHGLETWLAHVDPDDPVQMTKMVIDAIQALVEEVREWRAADACTNNSPAWFTGRWQDWHRGHGCNRDDGSPRTAEGAAEIATGEAAEAARTRVKLDRRRAKP